MAQKKRNNTKIVIIILLILGLLGIAYWVLEHSDFDLSKIGLEQKKTEEVEIKKTIDDPVFSEYVEELNIIAQESEEAWNNLAQNLENPKETDEWEEETFGYISEIEESLEHIEEIEIPEGAEDIHETYVRGIEKIEQAMENLRYGIEEIDERSIEKGAELLDEGHELREEAIEMIDEET